MKEFSEALLATTLTQTRKAQGLTQKDLADATGINRALISRIEQQDFMPSIPQLERLGEALDFDPASLFISVKANTPVSAPTPHKIAVAGTGYVGLSIAILLSQHNHVTAVDIVPEKVELINQKKSPIQDDYIEKYLAEKD